MTTAAGATNAIAPRVAEQVAAGVVAPAATLCWFGSRDDAASGQSRCVRLRQADDRL